MAKKIEYGSVNMGEENFKDENALLRVSIMLPMNLIKDLKVLSLTEEHGGKYQVLIRDVLENYVQHEKKQKRRRA